MQTVRINPHCFPSHRIYKPAQPTPRQHVVPVVPHLASSDFDFTNILRLLSADSDKSNPSTLIRKQEVRRINPRFDAKESATAYTLTGELPGVEQDDITVEWTDRNTLYIKGRSEYKREEPTTEAASETLPEAASEAPAAADDKSESDSSYHVPTVEDEDGVIVESGDASNTANESTPATTPAVSETPKPSTEPKWWISERSVGEFARTFRFSDHIDREAVRASLKNGILEVVVPKAPKPEPRRIVIG